MTPMRPVLTLSALCLTAGLALASPAQKEVNFDVPAQPLNVALNALAQQAGLKIVFNTGEVGSATSRAVKGNLTPENALKLLLQNQKLTYEFVDDTTVTVTPPKRAAGMEPAALTRLAQLEPAAPAARAEQTGQEAEAESSKGVPEILVKGSRSINTDIRRTEDDPQPYVVFSREEIQRSQASSVNEFLRTRLPMNTVSSSPDQGAQGTGSSSTTSSVNLRGLGTNQTLILVDGRRMPGVNTSGNPGQPDLNGIPLSAIERIEVLPSTAGGIYGGSATGGVINVILRRDFGGLETRATYANTFDTDSANRRVDLTGGFSLEEGRTQVMVSASISDANNLLAGDRDFATRAINLQRTNNPVSFATLTSPPLGATVNIRGVNGANLVLKPQFGNGAALISSVTGLPTNFTHLPLGYAGPASDGGAALRANAGTYNTDLPAGMQGMERNLLAAPSMQSLSLNVRREFGARIEGFLDASHLNNQGRGYSAGVPELVSNLPANAPNNPFQQAIMVRFPTPGFAFANENESTTVRATAGLIARLPGNWMGEVSYGWSRSRVTSQLTTSSVDSVGSCVLSRGVGPNAILGAPGPTTPCVTTADSRPALNVLQEGNTFPIDFSPYLLPTPTSYNGPDVTVLTNATVRLSGPVLELPGGPLNLSFLAERRDEKLRDSFRLTMDPSRVVQTAFFPQRSQQTDSMYLEARAPLISRENARPGLRGLELQASLRRDDYSTWSIPNTFIILASPQGPFPPLTYITAGTHSTDKTVGLRYEPLENLALRASFGSGLLPPSVTQIAPVESQPMYSSGLDPRRNNTPMYSGLPYTLLENGTPGLRPEQSESVSVGVILTPRLFEGLRLSVDYTRIDKVDEIRTPAGQFILDNEALYPGRVVRAERTQSDIDAGYEAGRITTLDLTLINIANTTLEAYDIQADYSWNTQRSGDFHAYALATYQPHYLNRLLPGTPEIERVGFSGGVLRWRGNMGLNWNRGPLSVGWNAQYIDSYWIYTALALPLTTAQINSRATSVRNQGSPKIPRQVYHDLIASWRFDGTMPFAGGLLADAEISVGIQNILDESPPIVATSVVAAAGYSTYGDPRLRRYTVSFTKRFGR